MKTEMERQITREIRSAADNNRKPECKEIKTSESSGTSLLDEAQWFMLRNKDYFEASIKEVSRFRLWAVSQENIIYRTPKQAFKLLFVHSVDDELYRQYKKAIKSDPMKLSGLLSDQPELIEAILQLKRPVDEKEVVTVIDIWRKTWKFTPKVTKPVKTTAEPKKDFRKSLLASLQKEIEESKMNAKSVSTQKDDASQRNHQNAFLQTQSPEPKRTSPAQHPRTYISREAAVLRKEIKEKIKDLSANSQGCWSKFNKIWLEKHQQLKTIFDKFNSLLIYKTEAHLLDLAQYLDILDSNMAIKTYCLGPMTCSFFPFKDKTNTQKLITKIHDYVNKTIINSSSTLKTPVLKDKLTKLQSISTTEIPMHFF